MSVDKDVDTLYKFCNEHLNLKSAVRPPEFDYPHLPLCVIDAVWSINVRYEGVQNVIQRYCNYAGLNYPPGGGAHISSAPEQTIAEFVKLLSLHNAEFLADTVFGNRQRTSPRNGILKAEAVKQFAIVLNRNGIQVLEDLKSGKIPAKVEQEIKAIPGQSSGLSLRYFYMVSGANHLIEPDRMIFRFVQSALVQTITPEMAQQLLMKVSALLKNEYPNLTPGLLDNIIWKYQREQ